jgi:hypothetical protein
MRGTQFLKWLQDCTQNHGSCALTNTQNTAWYPTRLLDLGSPGSGTGSIKLIETAWSKPEGHYITLGHYWGGRAPIMLTKEGQADFVVDVGSLPKIFKHAVEATRKLCARYLWIHSLDDTKDWMKEAALMHDIYRNAW